MKGVRGKRKRIKIKVGEARKSGIMRCLQTEVALSEFQVMPK